MLPRTRWLALFALLITILTLAPARAAETVRVSVPSRVIFYMPYWAAERQGYFKEEGIDARLTDNVEGREITRQLLAGQAQFSIVGPDAVLIDSSKGGPLRIIAGIVPKPPLFVIAKPTIKTFNQLRGATIGVLSLTEGSVKILAKIAYAERLAPADYTVKAVGGAPARWTLLKEGRIDAGLQPMPLNYEAEAAGFSNLGWAGKYEPDWQFSTVNVNSTWANKNPQIVDGFLRALLRGQRFLVTNPQEAARIATDELHSPLDISARSIADCFRLGILDLRLEVSEKGLRNLFESIQSDGAIAPAYGFDMGKFTDPTFLHRAQTSLAPR